MKKLFIYDIELMILGKYTTKLLKREKGLKAIRNLDGNIIYESNDREEIPYIIRKKYEDKLNKKIEEEGKVEIIDWSEKEFKCINCVLVTDYSIREATLKEAMEILTPEEFNEIYGNVLKLGGKDV